MAAGTQLAYVLDALSGAAFIGALLWALLWGITRVAPYLRFGRVFPELVLNAAGEAARTDLRWVERELLLLTAVALAAVLTFLALWFAGGERSGGVWMWVGFGLACLLAVGWSYFTVRRFLDWRDARFAARAHAALSATLGRLALQGHRVFHDVPLGELSVDHVVMGKFGVFAIKVVARRPGKMTPNVARINGRSIEFQDGYALLDTIALAERGARVLTDGTAKGMSHRMHVLPVVAVPGWEIAPAQGQAGETFLINEKSAILLLRNSKPADHLMDADATVLQEHLTRLCINRAL